jgi:hypothetical protein
MKAFGGQTPSMVLSRFPLSDTDLFILPSTNWRRVVYYAKVEIEKGRTIDYFCAQLSTPHDGIITYIGPYSNGDTAHGWEQEQLLQVQKIISWVKKKSEGRPAIIAGDWQASSQTLGSDGTTVIVAAKDASVIAALDGAFKLAQPKDYTPSCTDCGKEKNPYSGDFTGFWTSRTYLSQWASDAVSSASVIYTENVVTLPDGTLGPLSGEYGFNVRIVRPAQ